MAWVDVLEFAAEIASRKWRRRAATAFVLGLIVVPGMTLPAVRWYVEQRVDQVTDNFIDILMQPPTPGDAPAQDPRGRHHREGPARHVD